MVDVKLLAALAALEECGTVSEAAKKLCISQQACSARLKSLSAKVGIPLTQRGELTETGRLVAGWARPVLEAAAEFDSLTATLGRREKGLKVAASLTVAEHVLPGLMKRFGTQPVTVITANSATIIAGLRAGDIDVGIVETPHLPAGFHREIVGIDEMALVVAPGHPWEKTTPTLEEIAATALVAREEGSGTRATIDAAFRDAGLHPVEPAAEVRSTAAALTLARAGIAPTILSRRTLAADVAAGTLTTIPTRGLRLRRPLTMLSRTELA